MTKYKIALVITTLLLCTQSVVAKPARTAVRFSTPVKTVPSTPSVTVSKAPATQPVQSQPVNTTIKDHRTGQSTASIAGDIAIGAAAGVGAAMITDALLNDDDKQQTPSTAISKPTVETPANAVVETTESNGNLILVLLVMISALALSWIIYSEFIARKANKKRMQ